MDGQVLNIEQMQELIDMGIDTSKASMCYCALESDEYNFGKSVIVPNNDTFDGLYRENIIPTFTLQDILEILPPVIITEDVEPFILSITPHRGTLTIGYSRGNNTYIKLFILNSLLENAFNMLKWCKENNYI